MKRAHPDRVKGENPLMPAKIKQIGLYLIDLLDFRGH
jgi:hypothetical protein